MFPHTITIFNVVKKDGKLVYNRTEIDNVFVHIDKIIQKEENGDKYSSVYDVILSKEALTNYVSEDEYKAKEDFSDCYTIMKNDIVVIGSFGEISDLNDVQRSNSEFFLIRTISDNRYGDEELQNIEITD